VIEHLKREGAFLKTPYFLKKKIELRGKARKSKFRKSSVKPQASNMGVKVESTKKSLDIRKLRLLGRRRCQQEGGYGAAFQNM